MNGSENRAGISCQKPRVEWRRYKPCPLSREQTQLAKHDYTVYHLRNWCMNHTTKERVKDETGRHHDAETNVGSVAARLCLLLLLMVGVALIQWNVTHVRRSDDRRQRASLPAVVARRRDVIVGCFSCCSITSRCNTLLYLLLARRQQLLSHTNILRPLVTKKWEKCLSCEMCYWLCMKVPYAVVMWEMCGRRPSFNWSNLHKSWIHIHHNSEL